MSHSPLSRIGLAEWDAIMVGGRYETLILHGMILDDKLEKPNALTCKAHVQSSDRTGCLYRYTCRLWHLCISE